jgi:ABC-type branched-subunit amino acid transport system ATPase component
MIDLAIHTQGLGKRFGERAALERIDLEVPRGCAFGFLGPNGAGKTTLIRLLLELAKPTSGTIRLLGNDDRPKASARSSRSRASIAISAVARTCTCTPRRATRAPTDASTPRSSASGWTAGPTTSPPGPRRC